MTEPFRDAFRAPADLETIGRVHESFERLAEQRPDLPAQLRGAFELAVVEVVTNVVTHSRDDRTVRVELVIRTTTGGLEAIITDDAPPADVDVADQAMPEADDLAESGRGLALVTMLVDRFEHDTLDGTGNRWLLALG